MNAEPRRCDLAILTVIKVELLAMLKAFSPPEPKRLEINGRLYWETTLFSQCEQRDLQIVIGTVATAGLVAASLRTVRFLQDFEPTMIVLAGIAAGWREKQRIGDVVLPRNILDLAQSEAREGGFVPRPDHHRLPEVVAQMMQAPWFDDESLSALTEQIHGGWPTPKKGQEEQFNSEVRIPPNVDECVIACGDILVRRAGAFKKWQKTDPQVRAFEMESGGMIRAISDFRHGTPWLQVRGIADFGDAKKGDNYQPYAAAAAAAYVRLFAEHGFNRTLIVGGSLRAAASPPPVAVGSTPSRYPALVATGVTAVPVAAAANSLLAEFDKARAEWRVARKRQTLERLRNLIAEPDFQQLPPDSRAQVLRFTAEVLIAFDAGAEADTLIEQAATISAPSRVVVAKALAARSGPQHALKSLDAPANLSEWNERMALFLQADDADAMLKQWDAPPEGVGPDTESYRLRTLALIRKKDAAGARSAFEKINDKNAFAIRLAGAVLDYFSAVSDAAPADVFRLDPMPIPTALVKRDSASLAALDRAAATFQDLEENATVGTNTHRLVQEWRLASLSNHAARRAEAEDYCRQLLKLNPADPHALAWASARDYAIEKDSALTALAIELNINL